MVTIQSPPIVLMPLPDRGFEPTEAAIPWQACISRGWRVEFSTERGEVAEADPYKLKGPLPGLLSAGAKALAAYQRMTMEPAYQHPVPYAEIDPGRYQAILLPGGGCPQCAPVPGKPGIARQSAAVLAAG